MVTIQEAIQQAAALLGRGRSSEAEQLCRSVLRSHAANFQALTLLGVIAAKTRRAQEAADFFRRALAAKPDDIGAAANYSKALTELKRFDEALQTCERWLRLDPRNAEGHSLRGTLLQQLERPEAALASYDKALELKPGLAQAHYNLGVVLRGMQRQAEALASYERALGIKPDYAAALANRGALLQEMGRPQEALASYERALAIKPEYPEVLNNMGVVLQDLMRGDEAVQSFRRALELEPDDANVHVNLGNACVRMGRWEDVPDYYRRAWEIKPELSWLHGEWLRSKMRLCDWRDFDGQVAQLLEEVRRGDKTVLPFQVLAITDSPALQLQAAATWANHVASRQVLLPAAALPAPAGKIRLAYYSADFNEHATAILAAGLFEHHDRSLFELTAFSFGPPIEDEMRRRLTAAFDRFVDVRMRSDKEIALLSRDLSIDIAVDLKGYTTEARMEIFAHRAAPVQVSYLGYPGTMAASYMDYLIADETVIPAKSAANYTEKIVYLPDSYQVNDRKRSIAERDYTREELGLPPQGFVFCCFNNPFKITPSVFDIWMRILKRVEGSVLWLLVDSDRVAANLRREAEARGVGGARLVFAPHMSLPEHLARHRRADLFLDTHPYNAHTTTSDALWAGLPVLTRLGESFAARVAGSLLKAGGLPELITTTPEAYESLAVELAGDPIRLAELAQRLHRTRLMVPLFDTELFTRRLEDAYLQMYQRSVRGLSPDHLRVAKGPRGA
jgi:predicted O-linked N-acetylglucosamine transferase (SPINDLY family)